MSTSRIFDAEALGGWCGRTALALILTFAVVGLFQPVNPNANAKPWIGPDAPSMMPALFYAIIFGGAALLLFTGWHVELACIGACTVMIAVTGERLVRNPFTNLTADILIIM